MWEKSAAAFALSLCATCNATAQQPLKAEMTFTPYTSAGQLLGCSFEFTAIHKDRRAKAPFTGVNGTIVWFGDSRGLSGMFKIAGVDFDGGMRPTQFKVNAGVLKVDGKVQVPTSQMPCEQESNYCGAYRFDAAISLFRAIFVRPAIQIGYNRAKGGFDVMIDLPTEDAEILKLAECMKSLVDSMGGAATQ